MFYSMECSPIVIFYIIFRSWNHFSDLGMIKHSQKLENLLDKVSSFGYDSSIMDIFVPI